MGLRYAELHSHSNFSFQEGASSIDEMAMQAARLGYAALALTDHDNLCGAMEFGQTAHSLDLKGITGAEITLPEERHLTLLAASSKGYANLCRLLSYARVGGPHPDPLAEGEGKRRLEELRREPVLDPALLTEHAEGLVALSGCRSGEVPSLVASGRMKEAEGVARRYLELFGPNFYLELQHNLVYGDDARIRDLIALGQRLDIPVVATNNAHYHIRSRHRLQDALVAIKACKSLEESHRERRPNSEFFLKSPAAMAALFKESPEAIRNTLVVADRCGFDLTKDLDYRFPDYPVPEGHSPDSYLEHICTQAARRRYGSVFNELPSHVNERLQEELRLIRKHGLAGFLLIYHDVIQIAREVMRDLGLCPPHTPLEECLPGRGRGSSVAMLTGYLIGLSHIDPLQYNLSLARFLPEELGTSNEDGKLGYVPDIDLDFPRNIREELIRRVHAKWGWDHAALSGMIDTYQTKGAVRDLGKALGLPPDELDKLAKRVEGHRASSLKAEMESMPDFKDQVDQPGWRDLVALAAEIDGFPRHLAQHPGGMIISSKPLVDLVPVQPGAIDGRYVCQWDKDSIDDAGFVKIDFLSLGALSQMQRAIKLVEERRGQVLDLTRINFEDEAVYDSLCRADTIGIFQVESAAQMQTIVRLRPRNLTDMAYEVGAVRPGVGANHGVAVFLARRLKQQEVTYDHPLEENALQRTLGVILFQDQVNQLAMDVAGFSAAEADQLRRAFSRRRNKRLIAAYWERFREGAAAKGVGVEAARKVFKKFNGEYMFPESHAFAFGVTAYHASWLKYYYPLEFFVGLFNEQPMGFYNLETLKEDAKRHGVSILNPDVNRSMAECIIDQDALRVGFETVTGIAEKVAKKLEEEREAHGPYHSMADFMERTGLPQRSVEDLVEAGAFDGLLSDVGQAPSPAQGDGRGGPSYIAERPVVWDGTPQPPIPFPGVRGNRLIASSPHHPIDQPSREGPDRRRGLQEAALRHQTGKRIKASYQLSLPFGVDQDLLDLPPQSDWDRMEGEYRTLGLFPAGHVMSHLRRLMGEEIVASNMMERFPEGAMVTTAGLIIRRQHPLAKAIFLTLEDEFGHIPIIVWLDVYQRFKLHFKEPFVIVTGQVSRRDGTFNLIAQKARTFKGNVKPPPAKSWR